MNLDPLKPYLSLIKLAISAALLCGAFIAGCSYKAKDVAQLETQVSLLEDANVMWAEKTEEANKQVEANKQFAQEQWDRAEGLAKEIADSRGTTNRTVATLERQLEEAKRIPECTTHLQQYFCSAVPVYLPDVVRTE